MKFHAIQFDAIQDDVDANRRTVEAMCNALPLQSGDFIVLQEMTDTGWSMDLDAIGDVDTLRWGTRLASSLKVWLQVGCAKRVENRGVNCVSICSPDGDIVTTYEKTYTCNPFGENDTYDCGDTLKIVEIQGHRICPLICYDARFPELWRLAALEGVDVFTVSSSWPLARIDQWKGLLIGRAIENQAVVVASNRIGTDDIAPWGGMSLIISNQGAILKEASLANAEAVSSEINLSAIREWKASFPVFDDVKRELLGKMRVETIVP
ncbi:MAG: nitrilase-related carbon-nitrogen hydrolase [Planctomycetota bacterium]|nr:nitrilase-related carbon-nitrogen hydrolase [Planctomycetota bacterium]